MSKVYSLLPKLTVNEQFINEFISAQAPCFALGLVADRYDVIECLSDEFLADFEC